VAGTATAVSGSMQRHQMEKDQASQYDAAANQAAFESQQQMQEMQAQMAQMQAQQAAMAAPVAPVAAPAGGSNDLLTQLNQLAQLKESGMLSDEEFAAAKAKLLS